MIAFATALHLVLPHSVPPQLPSHQVLPSVKTPDLPLFAPAVTWHLPPSFPAALSIAPAGLAKPISGTRQIVPKKTDAFALKLIMSAPPVTQFYRTSFSL